MAKFYGPIGYALTVEIRPGVWVEQIIERYYKGELRKNTRRLEGDQVNSDINVANEVSILSDPFVTENFHSMRYVGFMGSNWKITSAEVQYPHIILTIGGLYNGNTPSIT